MSEKPDRDNVLQEYRNKSIEELLDIFFEDEPRSIAKMLAAQTIQEKFENLNESLRIEKRKLSTWLFLSVWIGFIVAFVSMNGIYGMFCK